MRSGIPEGWRLSTLVLVAIQLLIIGTNAPTALGSARSGEISVLTLLLAAIANALLLPGALLLLLRWRLAWLPFAASVLVGVLALLVGRWPPTISGIGIALIAALVSLSGRHPRREMPQ
jgi:hypothetical protein